MRAAAVLAVLSIFSAAPALAACGDDLNQTPCITRYESGWTHSFQSSESGVRVQVQTWGWVWDPYSGQWLWQATTQETRQQNASTQEEHRQWATTESYAGWDAWAQWNWNW